ncbi:aminotransferase DegT [Amycolatopsis sp. WAC 04182]|uniref:DegT/DnrJ/EryC1/StrS family aminotransferase n=1 Tax=Amycolatopsis sp. WAC 04182 TaxID=2203198 RepID=UPI000F7B495B|nr:DegT/DnrJ/EryC1/StrS family aminotransferase [Amycolatopsis sp. WAC 04182]RSN54432.1 aminotransferase DegT [Amycolatopsis sp. WAC 04182]
MTTYRIPQHGQGSGVTEEDLAAVTAVLTSGGHLSDGTEVARFEDEFARRTGAAHAVAVSSCTMALELATRVLELEPGDEIITTPLTFQATAAPLLGREVIVRFADIDETTLCLDPASVADALTPRTRAVFTTHYGGLCGGVEKLRALTERAGVALVEDCAHAIGASVAGRSAGTWGDIGCWSFHSLKNISTLGQGGMLTVRDAEVADRLRALRMINPDAEFVPRAKPAEFGGYGTGTVPRPVTHEKNAYTHDCARIRSGGVNAQLADPAAAMGRSQLRRLDGLIARRRAVAERLDTGLRDLGVEVLETPKGHTHAHHLYAFLLRDRGVDRDELVRDLEREGIEVVLRYFPVHLLPEWRRREAVFGSVPVAEDVWFRRLVNLPLSPQLGLDDADYVVGAVERALSRQRVEAVA